MLRLALLVLAVALAVLGGRFELAAAGVADPDPGPRAAGACCPSDHDDVDGDSDGDGDDSRCCSALHCPCVPHVTADCSPCIGELPAPWGVRHPTAWALLSEQLARDRRSAPPTRPPIG